jgi:hypothetical protein
VASGLWRFRKQSGITLDAIRYRKYGCFAAAAHQPTSPPAILLRRFLLARLVSLAPFVARPMAAQPPATPITSLAGATLFPFPYESAAFTASRPSRELLVNGRSPEPLPGLIGSPYSRREYSGTKCHPAKIPQAIPIPPKLFT